MHQKQLAKATCGYEIETGIWVPTVVAQLGKKQDRSSHDYFLFLLSPLPIQITEQEFKLVAVVSEPRHCQCFQVKPSIWARYAD